MLWTTSAALALHDAACDSEVNWADRHSVAVRTRSQIVAWQVRGAACDGVSPECLPLHQVVVPTRGAAACAGAAQCSGVGRPPRIYVYDCMDHWHETLVGSSQTGPFFDANVQRNQYLSEYALHRSLLQYAHRVRSPEAADFFFVPFYARLAYADKKATKRIRRLQHNLTGALYACLRHSPWWRRSRGRDHFASVSSTRNPEKLFGEAWPLLKRAVLLRIEAADDRYRGKASAATRVHRIRRGDVYQRRHAHGRRLGHAISDGALADAATLVVPYYVPHFAEDDNVSPASKRNTVCFFGSATNSVRRRAVAALSRLPGTVLALAAAEHFNASTDARNFERRRTLATRHKLRRCKLCLVPAGLTPSSRRFYEAIVAKCVPIVLADKFTPAFTRLLPLERYAVRAPQAIPEALPAIVSDALRRWPSLYENLQAVRSAFVYSLGLPSHDVASADGEKPPCDAAHAVLAELRARFAERSAQVASRNACLAGATECT